VEQNAIASFILGKDKEFRILIGKIQRQISTLLAYRKSLIHECVTGQRQVKEEDLEQVRHLS
jgi:type I restriction enzyme S subunit